MWILPTLSTFQSSPLLSAPGQRLVLTPNPDPPGPPRLLITHLLCLLCSAKSLFYKKSSWAPSTHSVGQLFFLIKTPHSYIYILQSIFHEVISFYHPIDIIIPSLNVSELRVKAVTRRLTEGRTGSQMQPLGSKLRALSVITWAVKLTHLGSLWAFPLSGSVYSRAS